MSYKIERISFHSHNGRTYEMEKEIRSVFGDYDYSCVSKLKSEDLAVMLDALLEKKEILHEIHLIPMELVATGISVTIPLESNDSDVYLQQLHELIHIIGTPKDIFENDGKFYANWTRNIVTWF